MDSQGFVPLTFIANFKRIKNLTEDLDLIRHCCHHARNVEHQLGADGVDRVRPREKWQQWVLPMDQRDPSARHDGPPAAESQTSPEGEKPEENVPAASSAQPSLTNGSTSNGAHVQSNGLPNGAAAAPEFTPAAAQSEVVNVSTFFLGVHAIFLSPWSRLMLFFFLPSKMLMTIIALRVDHPRCPCRRLR